MFIWIEQWKKKTIYRSTCEAHAKTIISQWHSKQLHKNKLTFFPVQLKIAMLAVVIGKEMFIHIWSVRVCAEIAIAFICAMSNVEHAHKQDIFGFNMAVRMCWKIRI